jgi:hypothetical protein
LSLVRKSFFTIYGCICSQASLSLDGQCPFIIRTVFPHRAIEIEDPKNGNTFKVNGQKLKSFLELRRMEMDKTLLEDPSYAE